MLRNQLIHGNATWNGQLNRQQVNDGYRLLSALQPVFLSIMMSNPHKDWGRLAPHYKFGVNMPRAKLFDPASEDTFPLSRTVLNSLCDVRDVFYLHRRLGVSPPKMIPLTLAIATDALLKNEFDAIRGQDVSAPRLG